MAGGGSCARPVCVCVSSPPAQLRQAQSPALGVVYLSGGFVACQEASSVAVPWALSLVRGPARGARQHLTLITVTSQALVRYGRLHC